MTAAPALFVSEIQQDGTIIYQAAAFHAGTAIPADDDHPAKVGEVLEMYGTGIGATDPAVPAGQASPANPLARAMLQPVVRIGDIGSHVLFAGLTPGLAGVGQVNIVVPSGLKTGRYLVALESGNANPGPLGRSLFSSFGAKYPEAQALSSESSIRTTSRYQNR